MEEVHPVAKNGIKLWNAISRTLHWLAGSFIFCEANAFRKVGGFSQELFAAEELDLSRARRVARLKLGQVAGRKHLVSRGGS